MVARGFPLLDKVGVRTSEPVCRCRICGSASHVLGPHRERYDWESRGGNRPDWHRAVLGTVQHGRRRRHRNRRDRWVTSFDAPFWSYYTTQMFCYLIALIDLLHVCVWWCSVICILSLTISDSQSDGVLLLDSMSRVLLYRIDCQWRQTAYLGSKNCSFQNMNTFKLIKVHDLK